MNPLFLVAEFGCSESGELELRAHLERTLRETRDTAGCLQASVWERPAERRFLFTTFWTDGEALARWVQNEFHRETLVPGFRRWCVEGSFSEFAVTQEHQRSRKCAGCGRWTQSSPGWTEQEPARCRQCGGELARYERSGPEPST